MKHETLEALVIDRELGELSPETAELLDAYLRLHPQSLDAANAMADTVREARTAVRKSPDLVPRPPRRIVGGARGMRRLAWAAAAVVGLGMGFAYVSARHPAPPAAPPSVAHAPAHVLCSPWARYQVAYDTQGGAYTVRRIP
jgi:hypothetical protein